MTSIQIENKLKDLCPNLCLACIEADVQVQPASASLLEMINRQIEKITLQYSLEEVAQVPAIQAGRLAYKACGKEPARYRLSAEALMRRIINGKGLWHINNVVDQLNLVSISTGFSIGGYDAKKIKGNIQLKVAQSGDPYIGIGRGTFNIEGLPAFYDDLGPFGTPTSDSERTSVTESTTRFLMVIFNFGGEPAWKEAVDNARFLMESFCNAKNIEQTVIRC